MPLTSMKFSSAPRDKPPPWIWNMLAWIAHARELSKLDVDSEIQPAFIDGASFQTARRIAQRFTYVGRRKLDSPPFERLPLIT